MERLGRHAGEINAEEDDDDDDDDDDAALSALFFAILAFSFDSLSICVETL